MDEADAAEMMADALNIEYDEDRDILTIDGFRYAGVLFRDYLHQGTPDGVWLRITSAKDGVITVQQRTDLVAMPTELVERLREVAKTNPRLWDRAAREVIGHLLRDLASVAGRSLIDPQD